MSHQALRVSYDILFDLGRDTLNPAAFSTFVTCATHTYPSDLCKRGGCVRRQDQTDVEGESTRVLPRKTRGDAREDSIALLGETLRFDG